MTEAAASRRSDSTRANILTAARERFASDGYDRATIRAIASDAGIARQMLAHLGVTLADLRADGRVPTPRDRGRRGRVPAAPRQLLQPGHRRRADRRDCQFRAPAARRD